MVISQSPVEKRPDSQIERCPRCRNLRVFIERQPTEFIYSIETFTNPGDCPACQLIYNILRYYNISSEWIYCSSRTSGPIELTFQDRERRTVEIFQRPGKNENVLPGIGRVNEIPDFSSSEASLAHVQFWLTECTQKHTRCGSSKAKALPTRVIKVGLKETDDLSLCETNGQLGRYAALSYCWGDSQRIQKTTRENLDSNKTKIDFSLLPQTVRDAVQITRRLAIPHLWVDALCIIQGDEEDWAKEAGKICDVYSNAYLTISASRSSGATEGCFGMQHLWGGPPHEFNYLGASVFTRVAKKSSHFHAEPGHLSDDSTEAINSRAWTLQETLLSNRTIFYTANELVWECNEGYLCECGINYKDVMDAGTEISTQLRTMRMPNHTFTTSRVSSEPTSTSVYRLWHAIVQMYTARHMSVSSDKLSALSGLAEKFNHFLSGVLNGSDQYLAGIWRGDIAEGLLWKLQPFPKETSPRPSRPDVWRAPSWSWASLDGSVVDARSPNDVGNFVTYIEVVRTHVKPRDTSDSYGRIRYGILTIQGFVAHSMTASRDPSINENEFNSFKHILEHGNEQFRFSPDDELSLSFANDVYSILHVATTENYGGLRYFLVLARIDEYGIDNTWRRVGLAESYVVGSGRMNWDFSNKMKKETVRLVRPSAFKTLARNVLQQVQHLKNLDLIPLRTFPKYRQAPPLTQKPPLFISWI